MQHSQDLPPGFFEEVWAPLRNELQRDYVGVWMIVGRVRRADPALSDDEVRRATLAVIYQALVRGEAHTGQLAPLGRFAPDFQDADTAVAEVAQRWTNPADPPDIGETAWFDAGPAPPNR